MKKCVNLIISMFVSMILSLLVIFMIETQHLEPFREFIFYYIPYLSGKGQIISNIFIGIFGSSLVTLIGYLFELLSAVKSSHTTLVENYRTVRILLIPNLGKESYDDIYNITVNKNIMSELKYSIEDYIGLVNFFDKIVTLSKSKKRQVTFLNCRFIPINIKTAYVLAQVYDYFNALNSNIYQRTLLYNEYQEEYRVLKSGGFSKKDILKIIKPIRNMYSILVKQEKILREHIIKLKIDENCKNIIDIRLRVLFIDKK